MLITGIAAALIVIGALLLWVGTERDNENGLALKRWSRQAVGQRMMRRAPFSLVIIAAAGAVCLVWALTSSFFIDSIVTGALVVIGALVPLLPVGTEHDEEGSPLPHWSRQAVGQRMRRRAPFLLAYLVAACIVLLVWILTRSPLTAGIVAGGLAMITALLLPVGTEHDESPGWPWRPGACGLPADG